MSSALALIEELDSEKVPLSELPNKQLYVNNPLSQSPVAQEMKERTDVLFASKPPNLAIQSEKAIHRSIVFFKAEGLTNREIADKTGYTEAWVSQITRQPWFQKALLDELQKSGRTSLGQFLEVQATDTVLKLVQLRDHATSESVQLSACINLLDRFLGKPVQRTEQKVEVHTVEEKVESIDLQLQILSEEENRLIANSRGSEQVPASVGKAEAGATNEALAEAKPSPENLHLEVGEVKAGAM